MSDIESEIPNPQRQADIDRAEVIPPAVVDKIRFEEPVKEKVNGESDSPLSASSSHKLDFTDPDEIAPYEADKPLTPAQQNGKGTQHSHQHFDWHHPFDFDFH